MGLLNKVTLQTPESVELEFTLAGIGSRAYALSIDYIILSFLSIFWIISFFVVLNTFTPFNNFSWQDFDSVSQTFIWLVAVWLLIAFFVYSGYFVGFETLWQGQTPGKRWAKIRVIRDNGRPVGLQQATLRSLLRPIDDTLFLGVFLIVFSKREKRLGDWVAGTIVVQEERAIATAEIAVSQEATTLVPQLQLEADLAALSPEDFAILRKYLHRRGEMIPKAQRRLSRQLANRVKEMIALAEIPETVSANQFLEAVYLAYQQQSKDYL